MYPPQGMGGTTDTVDGFHASATPIALQLLPLNASKVLPLDTPIPLAGIPTPLTGKSADQVDGNDIDTATSGHIHIGNVVIAWGRTAGTAQSETVNFPHTFTAIPAIGHGYEFATDHACNLRILSISTSSMTLRQECSTAHIKHWIAVGTI